MEDFADALFEAREVQGLGEEIFGVHGGGAFGDVAGERAHEDDGDFAGRGLAAKDFANGQAVEVRQEDVQQDQIRLQLPGLAEGVNAVTGHNQFIPVTRELVLQELDKVMLVIHNQYARHHAET